MARVVRVAIEPAAKILEPLDLPPGDRFEAATRSGLLPEQQEVVEAEGSGGEHRRPGRIVRAVGEAAERRRDGSLALRAGDARRPLSGQSQADAESMAARPDPTSNQVSRRSVGTSSAT